MLLTVSAINNYLRVGYYNIMDKKHRNTKYSLPKQHTMAHEKSKKLRTITGRSPKGI